jgi:hypothetical protein
MLLASVAKALVGSEDEQDAHAGSLGVRDGKVKGKAYQRAASRMRRLMSRV